MKFWVITTKVLGYIWIVLAMLFIFACLVMVWIDKGFAAVLGILSPVNIWNWAVTVAVLSPGFALLFLSEKLEGKIITSHENKDLRL